ncbi:MAG: ThuA domain-containing protein [Limnochordia bacterium]|jgi:type 1 glutamine amidotransferase
MKVLMLRHSAGYEHSYLPDAEVALKQLGKQHGWKVTTTCRVESITADRLSKLDVLVFATAGDLSFGTEQREAVISFVAGGKGFFGIHNATAGGYQWPEYGAMLGGYFSGHPWTQEVNVLVEETDHPATRMLGTSFRVYDEIYTFRDWDRSRTRVLLRLDNDSVDLSKGTRADHDYALAWCHDYGQGRVIYTALGHPDDLWREAWFLAHITGCLKWAGRLED